MFHLKAGYSDKYRRYIPERIKGKELYHSFGEFYRRGVHKVSLGVDSQSLTGATRLYERAGMHIELSYDAYEKELRPGVDLSTQTLEA